MFKSVLRRYIGEKLTREDKIIEIIRKMGIQKYTKIFRIRLLSVILTGIGIAVIKK